jgi:hypothetical protein
MTTRNLIKITSFIDLNTVIQELVLFSEKLQTDILGNNFEVIIEPSFQVNVGRRFNIVIVMKTQQFRDTLFCAYVPDKGFPVVLDFPGKEIIAEDDETLTKALYETIPNNEDIQSRLRAMIAIASFQSK